jgi:uncharacterized delta-60 repeat protein
MKTIRRLTIAILGISTFAWSGLSQTADSFNPGANLWVNSLLYEPNGQVLAVGFFQMMGGQSRTNIARLNSDGALVTAFHPNIAFGGIFPEVRCVTLQTNGQVIIGGFFSSVEGQTRVHVARLNTDGSLDSNFNLGEPGGPSIVDGQAGVRSIVQQVDGNFLISGNFSNLLGRTALVRITPGGGLDSTFNAHATGAINSTTAQADGKILVGGYFTSIGGGAATNIARLYPDGSLDTNFVAGGVRTEKVFCLVLQPDDKVLVGGQFYSLNGQPRTNIARLNPDGSLDTTFVCNLTEMNPPNGIGTVALQADGKILIGGGVKTVDGILTPGMARLLTNGTLEAAFDSFCCASCLTLQPDGKILAGGVMSRIGGQPRASLGRMNNFIPATQDLSYDGSTVRWLRWGSSPEISWATFEFSVDGKNWVMLGFGARIPGGWELTGVTVPARAAVRGRGFRSGGVYNGSWSFVETTLSPLKILTEDGDFGFRFNKFGFNVLASSGQTVVIQSSTNLSDWAPVWTNPLVSPPIYFSDASPTSRSRRFYRARLQ